ncbi:MAG: hypothetical protein U0736_10245 [Gemmataceae bacterium]
MAVVVVLGIHVSRAAADGIVAVVNSTDRNTVKVAVSTDGKATKSLTLTKDGGAASFELKGGKTRTLKTSGAPHNGAVTLEIPSGSAYHMLVLQITENGFVNVGASKAGKALKIK